MPFSLSTISIFTHIFLSHTLLLFFNGLTFYSFANCFPQSLLISFSYWTVLPAHFLVFWSFLYTIAPSFLFILPFHWPHTTSLPSLSILLFVILILMFCTPLYLSIPFLHPFFLCHLPCPPFLSLSLSLQGKVAQTACMSACKHLSTSLMQMLLDTELKQISMGAIQQFNLDVIQCECK